MMSNLKVNLVTLGCAKNRVDSENILGVLGEKGYLYTSTSKDADIIIINTCGFIETAKEESIEEILKMAKYKKTGHCKILIVAGCMVARYKIELMKEISEIDAILTPNNIVNIDKVIRKSLEGKKVVFSSNKTATDTLEMPRIVTNHIHSVYIKIAEGCNHSCSFCIIPKLRGRYKSRSIESILQEAEKLVEQGARELNLIAQDTSFYGLDLYGKKMLPILLKKMCSIPNLKWIRILYAHPHHADEELLTCIAQESKICSYLDVPLQHSNQHILKEMGRGKSNIEEFVNKCRTLVPDIVLRSTFIVGFPGERFKHFQDLMYFLEKNKIERVGVFKYSPEEGTIAVEKMNRVPSRVKKHRFHKIMYDLKQLSLENNKNLIGKTLMTITDKKSNNNYYIGRYYGQAPEVDGVVYYSSERPLTIGEFVNVKIKGVSNYDLIGEKQ